MKSRLFSIYDAVAEAFNVPFSSRTVAEAMRNFTMSVTGDESVKHSARDYILYEIGAYDIGTGVLEAIEPRRIFSAAEAIAKFQESEVERLKSVTPSAQR